MQYQVIGSFEVIVFYFLLIAHSFHSGNIIIDEMGNSRTEQITAIPTAGDYLIEDRDGMKVWKTKEGQEVMEEYRVSLQGQHNIEVYRTMLMNRTHQFGIVRAYYLHHEEGACGKNKSAFLLIERIPTRLGECRFKYWESLNILIDAFKAYQYLQRIYGSFRVKP